MLLQEEEGDGGGLSAECESSSAAPPADDDSDNIPTLEILNSQSISPDAFAAASNTLDESVTGGTNVVLDNPDTETVLEKSDPAHSQENRAGVEDMEVDEVVPDMGRLGEEKCEEADTDQSENSNKAWTQSQPENTDEKCEMFLSDSQSSKEEKSIPLDDSNSSALPPPVKMKSIVSAKQFPSRLLEELVKSCPEKKPGNEKSGVAESDLAGLNLPREETSEGKETQAPQSFQQSIREDSLHPLPMESMDTEGQRREGEEGMPSLEELCGETQRVGASPPPDTGLAAIAKTAGLEDIPIELVTAGTTDTNDPPTFSGEENSNSKFYGIDMDKYVSKVG